MQTEAAVVHYLYSIIYFSLLTHSCFLSAHFLPTYYNALSTIHDISFLITIDSRTFFFHFFLLKHANETIQIEFNSFKLFAHFLFTHLVCKFCDLHSYTSH